MAGVLRILVWRWSTEGQAEGFDTRDKAACWLESMCETVQPWAANCVVNLTETPDNQALLSKLDGPAVLSLANGHLRLDLLASCSAKQQSQHQPLVNIFNATDKRPNLVCQARETCPN